MYHSTSKWLRGPPPPGCPRMTTSGPQMAQLVHEPALRPRGGIRGPLVAQRRVPMDETVRETHPIRCQYGIDLTSRKRCLHCIASRKRMIKRTTTIGRKAPPPRGGNGKLPGGILQLRHHRDDGLNTDRTVKPEKSVKRLFMCGMSLTMNLVQNYSDLFVNSQRSSLSPTESVKSTSSTTEHGCENCIYSTNNIHMSDEDKHDTHYINKNGTNTYTRKLHNQ